MLGLPAHVRISVSGIVLPLDAPNNSQFFFIEVDELSGATAVHSP